MTLMKVKCPECKIPLELEKNEYDEGDDYECPECGAHLLVVVTSGKFKLKSEKEKFYDELDEADDFSDEED